MCYTYSMSKSTKKLVKMRILRLTDAELASLYELLIGELNTGEIQDIYGQKKKRSILRKVLEEMDK